MRTDYDRIGAFAWNSHDDTTLDPRMRKRFGGHIHSSRCRDDRLHLFQEPLGRLLAVHAPVVWALEVGERF